MSRLVSLVIPLFNEEENVKKVYQELLDTLDTHLLNEMFTYEFIFVDDGSKDRTVENLLEAANGDPRVKIIRFRRNFGQTAAMSAGFDYSSGEIVVTLDGDLQNDPREIPAMIAKLDEGYDIVAGWRKNRKDKAISRKLPSMMANKLISTTTKVKLHDYGCTLKVLRGEVAKSINLYGEMHRFIPAVASEMGVRIAEVPVNHRPRIHGQSKYGISRTVRVFLDLLTVKFFLGYSTRPLHMFGFFGLISSGIGGLMLLNLMFERFILSMPIAGRPMLIISVMLILIGMQFLCFGLLAEILVRTYHESQNKKIYSIKEVITSSSGGKDPARKISVVR